MFMVYKVNKMGCKLTLNGVAFSCSNATVNHDELRIMFCFLVPNNSPDTCLSNCTVSHPSRVNLSLQWEAQISTTSKMTSPSDMLTDTLKIKLLTHTTKRYLNLQSYFGWECKELLSVIKWDLRFSRWWWWCCLSPWSSHCKPVDM